MAPADAGAIPVFRVRFRPSHQVASLGQARLERSRVGTGETGALGSPGEAEPVGFGFVGVTVGFGVVGLTVGLVPPPVNEPVTASGVP